MKYKKCDNYSTAVANCFELNVSAAVDFVYRIKDIFVGYQTGFDTTSNTITKNDLGLGFTVNDTGFHFRCNSIPNEFGLSVHRKGIFSQNLFIRKRVIKKKEITFT